MSHDHCRAPEDGYYSFMFSARENVNNGFRVAIQRIPANDPHDITSLCTAGGGDYGYNTGSCSVSHPSFENMCRKYVCWSLYTVNISETWIL